jgi:hypothetical protein
LLAEYQAFERIALLCAHLCRTDVRFAAVGRRAEDEQFKRGVALSAGGFELSRPDRNVARIWGRTYQLPEVTTSVMRELNSSTPAAPTPLANPQQEDVMQTQTQDPNKDLNGGQQPEEETGLFAAVRSYCTVRNGVIAGVVVVLGTAVYLYVTGGTDVATPIA